MFVPDYISPSWIETHMLRGKTVNRLVNKVTGLGNYGAGLWIISGSSLSRKEEQKQKTNETNETKHSSSTNKLQTIVPNGRPSNIFHDDILCP